jgi:hypothetical protein
MAPCIQKHSRELGVMIKMKGWTTAKDCRQKLVDSIFSIDRPDVAPSYIEVGAFRTWGKPRKSARLQLSCTCLLGQHLAQLRVQLVHIVLQALQSFLQLANVLQLAYARALSRLPVG